MYTGDPLKKREIRPRISGSRPSIWWLHPAGCIVGLLTPQCKGQMATLQLLGERLKLHFISVSERNWVEFSSHILEPPHGFKFQHLPLIDPSINLIFKRSLVID